MSTDPSLRAPVPGPMAGYESPDDEDVVRGVTQGDKLRLAAGALRGALGVMMAGMALMYLPVQFWTPVMSGMGLIMVVNGSLALWNLGRNAPDLSGTTRKLMWVFPALLLAVFAIAGIAGPGLLGPDWDAMRARHEPATWKPFGL
jgi:hypothetical protein